MAVLMVCLGTPDESDPNYSGVLKMLTTLLSSEVDEYEKKKVLSEEFEIEMTEELERTVGLMCNLSEGVRRKAEAVATAKVTAKVFEEGIKSSIAIMSDLGTSKETATEQLIQKYALPIQQAQQYVNQYYPN